MIGDRAARLTRRSLAAAVGMCKGLVRRSPLAGPARSLYRRLWPLSPDEWNVRYDGQAEAVMARVLTAKSNCLDVGAHTGTVLRIILQYAAQGRHVAFEPLPHCAAQLRVDFPQVEVREVALSEAAGDTTFEHVVTNPGYSGLRRRLYERPDEEIRTIAVRTARLDDLVPSDRPITLVKIDVEGAELQVLRGGLRTLTRCKPFVIFEHGKGASDYYGTTAADVYDLLAGQCGLRISLMAGWLAGARPFTRAAFIDQCTRDFYFLAHP
jgi:FkbM family methyltransferase